ncbi:hypothetical protein A2U01_0045555, partial [Trifolium medium]|nr:hypothetical protein [Trifolium medium]
MSPSLTLIPLTLMSTRVPPPRFQNRNA